VQDLSPMALYGIILGSFPALSTAEIEAIVRFSPGVSIVAANRATVLVDASSDEVMLNVFDRLGGAVRLVSIVSQGISLNAIPFHLKKCLHAVVAPRPIFGITVLSDGRGGISSSGLQRWGLELKKEFRSQGRASRFVFNNSITLSAAQVKKNQLLEKGVEFVVLGNNGKWSIATTIAIQDVDEWSQRDMQRPCRDARRGMLPPKIARMMVNLAMVPPNTTILDPFCGSGTVLMEALQLGYSVVGSDASAEAVEDTKQNLEWFCTNTKLPITNYQLLTSDVRSLAQKLPLKSIDAIVTEPDLGPPQAKLLATVREIERTRIELSTLYFQALEEFKKLLKPGGRVVISFPVWRVARPREQLVYTIKDLNTIKGFNIIDPISKNLNPRHSLLYGRPEQFVWREIIILEKV